MAMSKGLTVEEKERADRRERIAMAALAAMITKPDSEVIGMNLMARDAAHYADALMQFLDEVP